MQWHGGCQGVGRWGQGGSHQGQWRGGSGASHARRPPSAGATTQASIRGPTFFYCGLDTSLDSVLGSPMRHFSGAVARTNGEEDVQVELHVLQGCTSMRMMMVPMLQLLRGSNRLTTPYNKKTEGALCETPFAGQGVHLEGAITFPHAYRRNRIGGELRLNFEDRFDSLSAREEQKGEKKTKIVCACV